MLMGGFQTDDLGVSSVCACVCVHVCQHTHSDTSSAPYSLHIPFHHNHTCHVCVFLSLHTCQLCCCNSPMCFSNLCMCPPCGGIYVRAQKVSMWFICVCVYPYASPPPVCVCMCVRSGRYQRKQTHLLTGTAMAWR